MQGIQVVFDHGLTMDTSHVHAKKPISYLRINLQYIIFVLFIFFECHSEPLVQIFFSLH